MKTILDIVLYSALGIITVDFLSFTAWIASGQLPMNDWYFGMITANIIKLFI